ncbi:MAG: hypothetical protein QW757_03975 [Candidatus Woesearchaeota archaeon]
MYNTNKQNMRYEGVNSQPSGLKPETLSQLEQELINSQYRVREPVKNIIYPTEAGGGCDSICIPLCSACETKEGDEVVTKLAAYTALYLAAMTTPWVALKPFGLD